MRGMRHIMLGVATLLVGGGAYAALSSSGSFRESGPTAPSAKTQPKKVSARLPILRERWASSWKNAKPLPSCDALSEAERVSCSLAEQARQELQRLEQQNDADELLRVRAASDLARRAHAARNGLLTKRLTWLKGQSSHATSAVTQQAARDYEGALTLALGRLGAYVVHGAEPTRAAALGTFDTLVREFPHSTHLRRALQEAWLLSPNPQLRSRIRALQAGLR